MNKIEAEEHQITLRIARLLRQRREEMGLSQQDVADYIGCTLHEVANYESHHKRIPVETLEIICRLLGTPIEYFFTTTPLELTLPPREFGLVEAWRSLDEKYRLILEEIAYVLAMHGKEV